MLKRYLLLMSLFVAGFITSSLTQKNNRQAIPERKEVPDRIVIHSDDNSFYGILVPHSVKEDSNFSVLSEPNHTLPIWLVRIGNTSYRCQKVDE